MESERKEERNTKEASDTGERRRQQPSHRRRFTLALKVVLSHPDPKSCLMEARSSFFDASAAVTEAAERSLRASRSTVTPEPGKSRPDASGGGFRWATHRSSRNRRSKQCKTERKRP